MGLEQNRIDSPFQTSSAPLTWVPAISNLVLAGGSILFLAYVAMQMRNLSVAVSDKTLTAKQAIKIKQLEKQLGQATGQMAGQGRETDRVAKEYDAFRGLVAKYFDSRKAKDDALDRIDLLEESLQKTLASLEKGVKGRKKKQIETEIKRVKAEGQRQIASVKEKSKKATADTKKYLEAIKDIIKREPAVIAPPAVGTKGGPKTESARAKKGSKP